MKHVFLCNRDGPVVDTDYGKIRGFCFDGIYSFRGIPYAKAKRFRMPEKPEQWEGIRDALGYGYTAPSMFEDECTSDMISLLNPKRYWPHSEDCQNLNVWTPDVDPRARLPVMVWLHGGGFHFGSAIEQEAHEGHQMASHGNIVFVSLNHRLNLLGYLDLSPFGKEYENTVNLGNADIVAALTWIQENISSFGGDPDNVTIFGQSGGGNKVASLLQTPAADGLFHKAIIMSSALDQVLQGIENTEVLIPEMLRILNQSEKNISVLENLPYEELLKAYRKAFRHLGFKGREGDFGPMKNDWYAGDALKYGFTEHAKKIPIMIGTVFSELNTNAPALCDEEKRILKKKFMEAYPEKSADDAARLDYLFRLPAIKYCRLKAAVSSAKVYNYLFTFDSPIDGGMPAWHCFDVPFAMHNIERAPAACGGEDAERLEMQCSKAWAQFARTGDPDHSALPEWVNCTGDRTATMILDRTCVMAYDHDLELLNYYMDIVGNRQLKEFQQR